MLYCRLFVLLLLCLTAMSFLFQLQARNVSVLHECIHPPIDHLIAHAFPLLGMKCASVSLSERSLNAMSELVQKRLTVFLACLTLFEVILVLVMISRNIASGQTHDNSSVYLLSGSTLALGFVTLFRWLRLKK